VADNFRDLKSEKVFSSAKICLKIGDVGAHMEVYFLAVGRENIVAVERADDSATAVNAHFDRIFLDRIVELEKIQSKICRPGEEVDRQSADGKDCDTIYGSAI
jgi:hypothetical protein